ncbi:myosin heavy chain, embryonic smooth muscle isoform-like [Hibiscus syriacus]|uniref:myosin heavy chain, embryonic smooth muscle isoform-like n=1 Tax=Hibiscus syriacus TaxID=106335 RepID=UPI001923B18A|nr:myosin heavy chain, embryonic smooth muscle isoform-like [Hibiscus syriacus]
MRAQCLHHTVKTLKIKLDRVERSARRGQEEKKRALQLARKLREQRDEANQELAQRRAQIEQLETQLLNIEETFRNPHKSLQKENELLKKKIAELEGARLIHSSAQEITMQENEALKAKIAELEVIVHSCHQRIQQLEDSRPLTNPELGIALRQAQDTIEMQHEAMERAVDQARDVARQVYELSEEAASLRVFVVLESEEERRIMGLMIELERLGNRARFYI